MRTRKSIHTGGPTVACQQRARKFLANGQPDMASCAMEAPFRDAQLANSANRLGSGQAVVFVREGRGLQGRYEVRQWTTE